jgi:tetratricopeptide (TPR) repeat protein
MADDSGNPQGVSTATPMTNEAKASWFFGVLFAMFVLGVFILGPPSLPAYKQQILAYVCASLAGFFGAFFTGTLLLNAELPLPGKWVLSGGAGFALFLIVLFWWKGPSAPIVAERNPNQDEVNQLLNAMTAAFSQGEYDNADRKAHEALKIDPSNPRALNMEGAVAFYRKDYQSAVDNFSASLKLRNDTVVTMNLADSYVEIGGYEKAIELYKSIDDGKPDLSYALGRAYLYEDNYQEALKHLQPVPSSFNHGSARVSEAAALVGMANNTANPSQRASLLSKASDKLREGLAEDTKFWEGIFDGNTTDIHEGHSKQILLLGSMYQKQRKD